VDHLPGEPARPRARPGQVLSRRLLIGTLLALVVTVVLVRALGLTDLIRLENLARLRERIDGLGAWAPLVFVLGYVAAVVAFVPALPLTILGGLVFGAAWGTVYVAIAATTGACLSFLIARYAARAAVARWMAGYPTLERMDRAVDLVPLHAAGHAGLHRGGGSGGGGGLGRPADAAPAGPGRRAARRALAAAALAARAQRRAR
jgi:hypothetical protein